MNDNLPQQNKERLSYYPALPENCLQEIEAIDDKDYNEKVKFKIIPLPVQRLLDSMQGDTVKTCIQRTYDGTPNLKQLSAQNPVAYRRAVKIMLAQMSWQLNVKEGMKLEQMNVIPTLLLSDYWYLTLHDINMICRNVMTGKYKVYERVDTQCFFSFVAQYDGSDERITAREEYHNKHKQTSSESVETLSYLPEDIKKVYKNLHKKLPTEKEFKTQQRRAMERLTQEKESSNNSEAETND